MCHIRGRDLRFVRMRRRRARRRRPRGPGGKRVARRVRGRVEGAVRSFRRVGGRWGRRRRGCRVLRVRAMVTGVVVGPRGARCEG